MKVLAIIVLMLIILCVTGFMQISGYKVAEFYCMELATGKHGGLICIN